MSEHPPEARLRAYVRRELPPHDLLEVDDHVAACERCRRALDPEAVTRAAAAFRAALAAEVPVRARPRRLSPVWGMSLAAALLLGSAAVLLLHLRGALPARVGAERPDLPGAHESPPAPSAPTVPEWATRLARQAVANGALRLDPQTLALVRGPSRTRGGGMRDTFVLQAPVGVAVADARPSFRWARLPGATSYTVTVSNAAFERVLESPPVATTAWQPAEPLAAGRTYLWQVTARGPAGEFKAPRVSDPEARFRILPADRQRALAELEAAGPSPIVRIAALAAEGLFDEAETRLVALSTAQPADPLPPRLLDDLRRRRLDGAHASGQLPPAPTTTNPAQ